MSPRRTSCAARLRVVFIISIILSLPACTATTTAAAAATEASKASAETAAAKAAASSAAERPDAARPAAPRPEAPQEHPGAWPTADAADDEHGDEDRNRQP